MKNAYVFFAEGFEEIEAITIVDVLRRAEIPTITISITGNKEVKGAHNIPITTDALFEDVDYSDSEILVLPGGLPGSHNLRDHKQLTALLSEKNAKGDKLAAICAAPYVLGELNILENKTAVCYPGVEDKLLKANVVFEPAVISENITTGRGVGAALNFALSIVKNIKGEEHSNALADAMLVDNWN